MSYFFKKTKEINFDQAVTMVKERLQEEGFGILTTIDVRQKFKEKLGIEFKDYTILGACHPPSARRAIEAEEDVGILLPCNVCVYQTGEGTAISVVKPTEAMSMVNNPQLREVAEEVEERLLRVFEKI